ncbi:MAG: hypothetical protein PHP83_02205 [Clostridia bacterium]|nr:hypothetical protein [Clostridia bacterium]
MTYYKKYYSKNDIEKHLLKDKRFKTKMYSSLEEMAKVEHFPDNGDNYNDVLQYTDYVIKPDNYKCYYIKGNIFPDDEYGTNEIIVQYNENEIACACFIYFPLCKGINEIGEMVKISIQYLTDFNKGK